MDFLHGVRVLEKNEGSRPALEMSSSVIGLVATASDADEQAFPLNKAVLITNITPFLAKAGTKGTLKKSLQAILDQSNAKVVVVRVETKEDEQEQIASTIGEMSENGTYTGAKALLSAQANLGVKPKIIVAPQLDAKEVAVELYSLADKLRGFTYVKAIGETKEQAVLYKNTFGDRQGMLIYGDFLVFNTATKTTEIDVTTARIAGLRAKIDQQQGWHKSISNETVNGVVGCSKDLYFDINETATDTNYLNENGVTALINFKGFRIWGNRTTASDPLFAFECVVRTANHIKETFANAYLWAIDKPISIVLAKDIQETMNAKFREWTTRGYLMGGVSWLSDTVTKDTIKNGMLDFEYDYTPCYPLENLNLTQIITDNYLMNFAASFKK